MKRIISAQALEGFCLRLRFSDGVEGVADLSDLAGQGVFSSWLNPGSFAQVHVTEEGAVAWTDGMDLCPDALYLRVTGKKVEELFPQLKGSLTHA